MKSDYTDRNGSDLTSNTQSTILVVDDTPDNLNLMSNLLNANYKVKIANGGAKALKIALSDFPPDLILLDIMMPVMDGYEVCRQLKLNPKTMDIPVIFLTSKAEVVDETKGLELGAVDYITKPISPPIVLARVKNHLALHEKNIALINAISIAEKANLAKSDFLSSMSHELRSPLNAILGFAQLMESDSRALSKNQQESITHILQAGWHLLKLINEILDLAKIEQRQVSLSEESVSLNDVLSECQSMIQPQAQQRDVSLIFPKLIAPMFVLSDRTRLKQILINLLSNAIKYNSTPGIIDVKCKLSTHGHTRISITDTGAGLQPEQLLQLFQPFNRLGQENSSEEGTGIGLVVTKRLVELMGGTIGVESIVGKGSVFWFELASTSAPIIAVTEGSLTELEKSDSLCATKQHSVLYVEDDPANMLLVEQIIARNPNIHLLTAVNGKNGIEIARTSQPHVILLDINLPDINGYKVKSILQSDPSTKHIPVIAVSANAMPSDIEKGMMAGFFQYITKPIRVNILMEAIDLAMDYSDSNMIKAKE